MCCASPRKRFAISSLTSPRSARCKAPNRMPITKTWPRASPELYQPETLRRIQAGANVEQAEIDRRRQLLAKFRRDIDDVFRDVDVLVTPTTPIPAPAIADLKHADSLRERELILLRNTRPFNVWGLPAISVPCGFTQAGLPIGLQIAGHHWQEARVLQLAHAYEQSTVWHKRQPHLPA